MNLIGGSGSLGWAWRSHSPAQLPVHLLLPEDWCSVACQPPIPAIMTSSLHGLSAFQLRARINPSFLRLLLVRDLVIVVRNVTKKL